MDLLAAILIVFIIFYSMNAYFTNFENQQKIDKDRAIMASDSQTLATLLMSHGNPTNWTSETGTPGLLCENQVCTQKLDALSELCSNDYNGTKESLGIYSNFSISLYNSTYRKCFCNCQPVNAERKKIESLSVLHNNSLYGLDLILYSYKEGSDTTSGSSAPSEPEEGKYYGYCGDSICYGIETCINCETDCGVCGPDTPPQFDNSTAAWNSTYAGTDIKFSLKWTDNLQLSGFSFSFDNGTGTFYNDSWVAMNGTTNWSNVTKSINSTTGSAIRWRVFANDSNNQWNVSQNYSFTSITGLAISFSSQTPSNGTTLYTTAIYANTLISTLSNASAIIDFNGSLLGWWSFESYNSSHIFDNSSYRNNASFSGGIGTGNLGTAKFGNGLTFDGFDDKIIVPDSRSLDIGAHENFTIEVWVKTTQNPTGSSWPMFIHKENTSSPRTGFNFYMAPDTNGRVCFDTFVAANYSIVCSASSINNNAWHHVVAMRNGTNYSVYVDTALENSTLGDPGSVSNNMYATIGGDPMEYFQGSLDEVRMHKRALTQAEINASYNAKLYPLYHNFTALLDGNYNMTAMIINSSGSMNKTDTRFITINADSPLISFIGSTPDNLSTVTQNSIYLNTSVSSALPASALFDFDGSLVGWWSFDFYDSTHMFDNSSYSAHATFNGGMGTGNLESGKLGKAIYFDGTDDRLVIPNNDNQNFGDYQNFTLEAWVKTDNNPTGASWPMIIRKQKTTGHLYGRNLYMVPDTNGRVCFDTFVNDAFSIVCSASSVNNLQWHHIAAMRNGTNYSIYIDGRYENSSTGNSGTLKTSTDTYIGGSSGVWFKGLIDEVRVHNRALSPQEINASYSATLYALNKNFTGLTNGVHNFNARIIDQTGEMGSAGTRTVTVSAP